MTKTAIVAALYTFIHKRPCLEYSNYNNAAAYRAEARRITRDLGQARQLLHAVELRESITAADVLAASRAAFCGRLSISQNDAGAVIIDYCAGQYWPVEYRLAVGATCAQALSRWCLDSRQSRAAPTTALYQREFGRGLAARWFK